MRFFVPRLAVIAAALFTACAQAPLRQGSYVVDTARAPFFKNGPAQGTGPDVSLSCGDRVTLLASEHGFSRVRLADGREGYVASGHLRAVRTTAQRAKPAAKPRANAPRNAPAPALPEDNMIVPASREETRQPRFRF